MNVVYAGVAALVVMCSVSSAALAEKVRVFGDRYYHPQVPEEFIRTYVDMPKDHDENTVPLSVGMQMTPGFVRAANDLPISWKFWVVLSGRRTTFVEGQGNVVTDNFTFVMETNESPKLGGGLNFPQVGRNPFKFATSTYNRNGHPPIGVYDYEHFDIRFFMVDQEWWWGEQFTADTRGPCALASADCMYNSAQPMPAQCWPGDPKTSISLGHFSWGQGIHIYDTLEPGFQEWAQNSSLGYADSFTWGAQAGQIAYVETMFSRDKALEKDLKLCKDLTSSIPKRFDTERLVPTRKCLLNEGGPTIKVQYDKFITVPGGCQELRNSTSPKDLVGWFPQDLLKLLYEKECRTPVPPS